MAAVLSVASAGGAVGAVASDAHRPSAFQHVGAAIDQAAAPTERPWSAEQRLTFAEYLGAAPSGGGEGARTVYLLRYESRCRGRDFTFDVAAVFVPEQSWVKPAVLASPGERARVLQHERTHFDLTEVYARRMRKYFATLYDACGQDDAQLGASIDRFVKDEAAAQQRYDEETDYGLSAARQRTWNQRVTEMLASLEAYARKG